MIDSKFYNIKDGKTYVKVRVTTRASKNAIVGVRDSVLLVSVTSVPENNKANNDIIKLFSKEFGVAKSKIQITSGDKCKNKVISLEAELPQNFYLDITQK